MEETLQAQRRAIEMLTDQVTILSSGQKSQTSHNSEAPLNTNTSVPTSIFPTSSISTATSNRGTNDSNRAGSARSYGIRTTHLSSGGGSGGGDGDDSSDDEPKNHSDSDSGDGDRRSKGGDNADFPNKDTRESWMKRINILDDQWWRVRGRKPSQLQRIRYRL